jgi:hypothetical protein
MFVRLAIAATSTKRRRKSELEKQRGKSRKGRNSERGKIGIRNSAREENRDRKRKVERDENQKMKGQTRRWLIGLDGDTGSGMG